MLYMIKVSTIFSLAFLVSLALGGIAPCPLQLQIGSVLSGRIIIAKQQALIPLIDNSDVQCYNYTLPYTFGSVPQVALAVHDFGSRTSNDLFFSIKPLESESLGTIPFLIRTHWRYTYWTKIVFSFLAEDRKDLEAGYYQVDSGLLGGCQPGKSIQIMFPFHRLGLSPGKINHNLFLHGFEISAQKIEGQSYSPFEIQIIDSAANSSGISVLLSVTTVTQVHSLHISYLAWYETSNLEMVVGSYVYEGNYNRDTTHSPGNNVGRNYARIYGLTGFVINNNYQSISLSTTWTGSKFMFDMGSSQNYVQYFTFAYIFFIGSQCSACTGYPYFYEDRCQSFCPPGSFATIGNQCINCGENYFWDGSECVKLCPQGQILDRTKNQCACPIGSYWTGINCITCTNSKSFNPVKNICECLNGTRWNGYTCAKIDNCTNGRQWNLFTFTCQCPLQTFWNGTYCIRKTVCKGGQIVNQNNQCSCPEGTYFKDEWCQSTGCAGGQVFKNGRCECELGYNWNGTVCLLCINGQAWNQISRTCLCPIGTIWNGNFCEKYITCTGGRIYNKDYDQCLCSEGMFWNGAGCMKKPDCCCGKTWNETTFECNCPSGFNWDERTCVLCINGKIWEQKTKTCICPPGTQWNGQFCAVIQNCFGGMIWNQNTWSCECPASTVWNGNYCIANPCIGGQVWDNSLKQCICVGGKIYIDGKCVPPQITCTYGRFWDSVKYACICPDGKWNSGSSCETIPVCKGNQIYKPTNNKCECASGLIFLQAKNQCGDPTCPYEQRWDGYGCVNISCPPNSFYNGTECICPEYHDNCQPWEYFDGQKCIYFQDTCPVGTKWGGKACNSVNSCPVGFYGQNNACKPFSQRCIPPTVWQNGKCLTSGNNCPYGTYSTGRECLPHTSCQNGQKWNQDTLQCVCPQGTGWNGQQCVSCGGSQVWDRQSGCICPEGHFFAGSTCEKPTENRCRNIPNANWNSLKNLCSCDPGFTVVGYQCICKGVPFEHFCDRCAYRPHSEWKYGICQCQNGYTLYGTQCLPNLTNGGDNAADCGVATYFDTQQKKCLSCPDGCLSCDDCYTCKICNIHFQLNPISQLCEQNCGDGYKYVSECDDKNNVNGDGCSIDCKVEQGYTCRGGSPNSADSCITYQPSDATLIVTGQIRYSTKIVVNVKLDYMPRQLLQSTDCNDRCSLILVANVSSSSSNVVSVKSYYIPGTIYSFSVQLEFGKPFISKFNLEIGVNPALSRYFKNVKINKKLTVEVNPAYLSTVKKDILS